MEAEWGRYFQKWMHKSYYLITQNLMQWVLMKRHLHNYPSFAPGVVTFAGVMVIFIVFKFRKKKVFYKAE